MKTHLIKFKKWFDARVVREKLLVIGLIWAFIYAVFSLLLFQPLDKKITKIRAEILEAKNQLSNWHLQIEALKKIGESELYKNWVKQEKIFENKKNTYKSQLILSSAIQWQGIVKSVLSSWENVTIEQIQNKSESLYVIPEIRSVNKIYQQKLNLIVTSNYFDTINYLKRLEKILPTIHWDSLSYKVIQYPKARIEMEFSVLYEKPDDNPT